MNRFTRKIAPLLLAFCLAASFLVSGFDPVLGAGLSAESSQSGVAQPLVEASSAPSASDLSEPESESQTVSNSTPESTPEDPPASLPEVLPSSLAPPESLPSSSPEESAPEADEQTPDEEQTKPHSLQELLEMALLDGGETAQALNAYENDTEFITALREILNLYYTQDLPQQLADFSAGIDMRAADLLARYAAAAKQRASAAELEIQPGQILVAYHQTLSEAQAQAAVAQQEGSFVQTVEVTAPGSVVVVDIPLDYTVEQAVELYSANESVAFAQPIYLYRLTDEIPAEDAPAAAITDPLASNYDQWHLDKIDVHEAWDILATLGTKPKIRVAVIDTQMDLNHPDLAANINKSLARDASGGTIQPVYRSVDSHATHVAGIIGSTSNNGIGGAGVASGSANNIVEIMPLNVFVGNSAATTSTCAAIQYAADNGARVINLSLGHKQTTDSYYADILMETSINYAVSKNVVVVVSAGNENTAATYYPSDFAKTISVISTDNYSQNGVNSRSSFSNYGSAKDISAPGRGIISTYPTAQRTSGYSYGYGSMDGTSMAAPIVTAVAAMILYANPAKTPEQVRSILNSTATDLYTAGRDVQTGWGNVNARAAVAAVVHTVNYPALGGLRAKPRSYNSIQISWAYLPKASGYSIWRSTSASGSYQKIGTNYGAGKTTFASKNLQFNTNYYYRVQPFFTEAGVRQEGNKSGVAVAKAKLTYPTNVKATTASLTSIRLSWSKAPGAHGYLIYRNGQYITTANGTSGAFTNTGLKTGYTYSYRIVSYRRVGQKFYYSGATSKVYAKTTTPAPKTFHASTTGRTSIKLVWSRSSGATGYYMYRSASKGSGYKLVKILSSGYSKTFTNRGLAPGKTYYYKIVPYHKQNGRIIQGATSSIVAATTWR